MIVWITAYWIVIGMIARELVERDHWLAMVVVLPPLWVLGAVMTW